MMLWYDEYVPGTEYPEFATVRDGDWVMVANAKTDDRPAPQPVGDSFWHSELGDTPAWSVTNSSTSLLITGQRYTFTKACQILGYRVWIPTITTNWEYEVWTVRNPTTTPVYRIIRIPFPADTLGWFVNATDPTLVGVGATFDLLLVARTTGTPTTFNAPWNYARSGSNPVSGQATHDPTGAILRIHNVDNNSVNQRTSLAAVTPGGTIQITPQIWTVTNVDTTDANFVEYTVIPQTRVSNALYTFNFSYTPAASIDYSYITNWYNAAHEQLATVDGYFSSTGYDPSATLNQNAYGVDIFTQEMTASPDWDFMAFNGFTAGGSGGTPTMGNAAEQHFPIQVAMGNLPGYASVNKYGQSTNVDSGVATDIWDGANATDTLTIWTAPTQARIHNIVSTSTSDIATTGAGARTIQVYGLTSWTTKEVSEVINMNGTTNVPTSNSYVIIHRMKVLTKGATSVNVGKITATAQTDGTVTAQINAGEGQTQMAIYGWPSVQDAYLTQVYGSILRAGLGTTEAQADVRFLVNPEPDVELLNFQIKHPTMVGSRANSPFNHTFIPYAKFEGPAIMKMQAIGSANNLDIAGGFSLVLADN